MSKADLRSAAFKNPPRKRITVEYNGQEFDLLAPTVKVRKEIINRVGESTGSARLVEIHTWTAIFCTVVPKTMELVFEETDYASFESMSLGGFLDIVAENCFSLLNLTEEPKKDSAD